MASTLLCLGYWLAAGTRLVITLCSATGWCCEPVQSALRSGWYRQQKPFEDSAQRQLNQELLGGGRQNFCRQLFFLSDVDACLTSNGCNANFPGGVCIGGVLPMFQTLADSSVRAQQYCICKVPLHVPASVFGLLHLQHDLSISLRLLT